jgi:hypothetical protein
MANHKWGHCEHCRFFASPALVPVGNEESKCMHPVLAKYDLLVFGAGGCSGFELRAGLPESVERPAGTAQKASGKSATRRVPIARAR